MTMSMHIHELAKNTSTYDKAIWDKVNKRMVAKFIRELAYEKLLKIEVEQITSGQLNQLKLQTADDAIVYTFLGAKRKLENWHIDENSLKKWHNKKEVEHISVLKFMQEVRPFLKTKTFTFAKLLEEISNTLIGDANYYSKKRLPSAELIDADYATIEAEMHAHPWIVVNKGRMGFGADDAMLYAPELGNKNQFVWIAVKKARANFNAINQLKYEDLMRSELSRADQEKFDSILENQSLNANDYFYMPVHEWQWKNRLFNLFAEDIAQQHILPLDLSEDVYMAQLSIRTFQNVSYDNKLYVKLPISILNTSVYRGLPGERTQIAPMVTSYLKDTLQKDKYLKDLGFVVLGEIASINYDHPYYKQIEDVQYYYNELLGVIWRENMSTYLQEGEQAFTMSAVLHEDEAGVPFIKEMIDASGLPLEAWLKKYVKAYVHPVLHCMYQYGVVFSPHGQNSILIVKDNVPTRIAIKDLSDDVNISSYPLEEYNQMPDAVKDVLLKVPELAMVHFIQTGLFVSIFRYLSNILLLHYDFAEEDFWKIVKSEVDEYKTKFPNLKDRYKLFNLEAPYIDRVCLHRVRLQTFGYDDYSKRPEPEIAGIIPNPLYEKQGSINHAMQVMKFYLVRIWLVFLIKIGVVK